MGSLLDHIPKNSRGNPALKVGNNNKRQKGERAGAHHQNGKREKGDTRLWATAQATERRKPKTELTNAETAAPLQPENTRPSLFPRIHFSPSGVVINKLRAAQYQNADALPYISWWASAASTRPPHGPCFRQSSSPSGLQQTEIARFAGRRNREVGGDSAAGPASARRVRSWDSTHCGLGARCRRAATGPPGAPRRHERRLEPTGSPSPRSR